jgi:hypothetical protein
MRSRERRRTLDSTTPSYSVCILAHNEEKNIARTLAALCDDSREAAASIYVYANGCTDRTVKIVRKFGRDHNNVHVRELPVASKPNAWNMAFSEQLVDHIIFADGDILPDVGAAGQLVAELRNTPQAVIATCRQVPLMRGLSWQRKCVGFMQLPLVQDFLAGGFYAVRRQALAALLAERGYTALPAGVTGEDCFLDAIAGTARLRVAECRSAYEPPDISDYCRYLARIRWQNEQLSLLLPQAQVQTADGIRRLINKLKKSRNRARLLPAGIAVSMRYLFKLIAASAIKRNYRALGPVRMDGASILQNSTRSFSSK